MAKLIYKCHCGKNMGSEDAPHLTEDTESYLRCDKCAKEWLEQVKDYRKAAGDKK